MTALIATVPKMDLAIHDIEHLVEALHAYHAIYSPLLQRREQREAAHTYLQGLLATLPRQAIEPMVLAVDGVALKAVRAMQSFISEGRWDDERLLHQHWQEVERALGADDGVLMVDGSDFPKQGVHAAGVKRQYWGELGKWANCQAGGFVGYVRCFSGCAATHVEGTGPTPSALCYAPQEPRVVVTVWSVVLRARMLGWSREYATTSLVTGIVLIPFGRLL